MGIAADLLERSPELDHHKLSVALTVYTRRVMYLRSLVAGAARVDLDGKEAGEVTARDAEYATAKLAKILASREAAAVAAKGEVLRPQAPAPSRADSKGLNAEEKARAAAGGLPSTALARPWCVRIQIADISPKSARCTGSGQRSRAAPALA